MSADRRREERRKEQTADFLAGVDRRQNDRRFKNTEPKERTMLITRISPLSGAHTMDLPVTAAQLELLASPGRPLIQDIFPDLTPAQREFIKTGYTQADWELMFPPEQE